MTHKAGFVNIIGRPNVGKSTLMNQLVGEKLSIITSKAQTTRHRILGIINAEDFQIIYSDTPGIIKHPSYKLQEAMNDFVKTSFEDADVLLFVTDIFDECDDNTQEEIIRRIEKAEGKKILLINKIDLDKPEKLAEVKAFWESKNLFSELLEISALQNENIEKLLNLITDNLPEHPAFFPKDQITDKPERFFMSEIIREKIFLNYKKEVPYSTEVEIEFFKEDENIVKIGAVIYVERKSQKGIIIGKNGDAIKKVGTEARLDMETFLDKKVFLEMHVKVSDKWRTNERTLKGFGYKS